MNLDPQQIEFLLSQIPDGVLSAEERRALDAALAADPSLSALAVRYDRLARLLTKFQSDCVHVDASALTDAIREAIATELQFRMSQDLDQQLPAAESDRLDRVLAGNLAQQREEQRLRDVQSLVTRYAAARSVPEFEELSSRISAAVRREPITQQRRVSKLRIISWKSFTRAAAIAAVLGLAVLAWRPWSKTGIEVV